MAAMEPLESLLNSFVRTRIDFQTNKTEFEVAALNSVLHISAKPGFVQTVDLEGDVIIKGSADNNSKNIGDGINC